MELVSIDSPSGEEENVAREIGRRLEAQGLTVKRDAHGNVIASLAGQGDPFLLSAHMDTVEPGRGIKPVVDGDTIRTDGSTVLGGDPRRAWPRSSRGSRPRVSRAGRCARSRW